MQPRRTVLLRALVLDRETFGELFEQLLRRQAVQVFHDTVVVDDPKLPRGESHGEEIAILLVARMAGVLCLALLSHARRGGCAVMPVGDIERRDARENLRDTVVGLLVADNPQLMAEAVGSREIVFRVVVLHHVGHDGVDLGVVGIGEEHRFDIGLLVADVDHAVFLLVGTRQFVFLDRPREVILVMAAHGQSVLRAAVHRLRIDVIILPGILFEPALLTPCTEILDRLVVNLLRMFVGNRLEIYFGLDDVQQRAFGGLGLGLGGIQHVIGARRHFGRILFRGTYPAKRFDFHHMN